MKSLKFFEKIFKINKQTMSPSDALFEGIKSGDICIDCGANVGTITELMSKHGAIVHSFEPNPHAFNVLKEKFKDNNNIYLYNKGVWDRNTKTKLYFHEHSDDDEVMWSTGSSILEYKGNVLKQKYVEIEIIDLVEFIIKMNKEISILKIDIEGAECELLEKIINTKLYKKIKHIYVETHDHKIPELKSKTDTIRKLIKQNGIKNINLDWI
ncbi:MAG TPA: FkbM family methyltransferase [Spirochaetota bacterium]|nr:FkbM family methyltransferase [Spirochaetota bacterium]